MGQLLYAQEDVLSTPLEPGYDHKPFYFGVSVGEIIPLSPNILTSPPTIFSKTVEKSLTNGLNGIGYGTGFSVSGILMNNITSHILLSLEGTYSKWTSNNTQSYEDNKIVSSVNSMTIIQFSLGLRYFYHSNFYFNPEVTANIIPISVKENDTRGVIDFSKTYYRIGAGIGVGTYFRLIKNLDVDVNLKAQAINLLLRKEDDLNTPESEALIKSFGNTKEEIINLITLKFGLIYSL
jgi:hypothetical protein